MPDASTDSSVLLYGILASEAGEDASLQAVVEEPGVHEAPLTLLPFGSLAALASPLSDRSVLRQPEVDTLLTYKETIDAAYEACTVVPFRFGTWADSREEARSLVTERARAYRVQLERFEGRVEIGLRLTLDAEREPAAKTRDSMSGAAYLRVRRRQYDRTQKPLSEAFQEYREAVTSLVVDSTVEWPDKETLSAAFLVPRKEVETFARTVSEVRTTAVDDVQIVGPCAPFSFASLPLRTGMGEQPHSG